jgi:hypothetical protein
VALKRYPRPAVRILGPCVSYRFLALFAPRQFKHDGFSYRSLDASLLSLEAFASRQFKYDGFSYRSLDTSLLSLEALAVAVYWNYTLTGRIGISLVSLWTSLVVAHWYFQVLCAYIGINSSPCLFPWLFQGQLDALFPVLPPGRHQSSLP